MIIVTEFASILLSVKFLVEDFTINATYAPAEFSAGSLEATVQIDGISDSIKECDESFRISASLTSSSTNLGVTLGDDIATVTVVDKTEGYFRLKSPVPTYAHLLNL